MNEKSYYCIKAAKILESIDESISPCDDFYQFACGKWIESTVIPDHRPDQTTTNQLQNEVNIKLKGIINKNRLQ